VDVAALVALVVALDAPVGVPPAVGSVVLAAAGTAVVWVVAVGLQPAISSAAISRPVAQN